MRVMKLMANQPRSRSMLARCRKRWLQPLNTTYQISKLWLRNDATTRSDYDFGTRGSLTRCMTSLDFAIRSSLFLGAMQGVAIDLGLSRKGKGLAIPVLLNPSFETVGTKRHACLRHVAFTSTRFPNQASS